MPRRKRDALDIPGSSRPARKPAHVFSPQEDDMITNIYPLTGQYVWDVRTLSDWMGRTTNEILQRRRWLEKRRPARLLQGGR